MTFYRKPGVPLPADEAADLLAGVACGYKNLHRFRQHPSGLWSITAAIGCSLTGRGPLLCYADEFVMTGCRAVVSESGRQRIIRTASREVVAWFAGQIDPDAQVREEMFNRYARVTFHPFERPYFFRDDTDADVFKADEIYFGRHGMAWLQD